METGTSESIYDPQFVRGLFNRMSRSYERMNLVMSFGFAVTWRRQLMRLIDRPGADSAVIDLMCGMGETWEPLRWRFPSAAVTALDFSPDMIEHARSKSVQRFGGTIAVRCEDVLQSSLPTETFDVVVCAYGLKTFDAAQSLALGAEVSRILKPGGQFAFIEVTQPPNRMLRKLYDLYLSIVVPLAGRLLISDPTEYRMLYRYVRAYGAGERSAAGFARGDLTVTRRSHFFGCATSFSGRKVTGGSESPAE
ncbi:MAG: class I SAM-dependent methyltransferase [Pseudolysinimonas sp.]